MKASVYIPCYNAEKTIQHCLEAVFKQSYPLEEVVVIDDCSTDRTVEIASRYPVRVIKHAKNSGLAAARNTAVKNINTEFIASLDADCLLEPNWLKQLMARFSSLKIAGAGGKLQETYSSTLFDLWRSAHMKQYWDEDEPAPPFLFGSNVVFRREAIVDIGLYREDFKNNYEDVDICERLKEKGYVLIYEAGAIAHHLKRDNLHSVLNTYWRWNFAYYKKNKFYSNRKNFIFKLKDNLGLAQRYIEEDAGSRRHQLVYLDFLLALHHSLKDLEYFIFQGSHGHFDYPLLSPWLSLLDLTFFYHFNSAKKNLSSLLVKESAFLQNLFALNLLLGKCIKQSFNSNDFSRVLYRHLLLSLYGIDDSYLSDKLLNLIESQNDWDGLFQKRQPNLDIAFLKNLSLNFQDWLKKFIAPSPGLIKMIEISAEQTDRLFSF